MERGWITRGLGVLLLAAVGPAASGCYTTLTSPKEDRSFREIVGRAVERGPVALPSGALVMTAEFYHLKRQERKVSRQEFRIAPLLPLRIRMEAPAEERKEVTIKVRQDGYLDFDMVTVEAAGKTYKQLQDELTKELTQYYVGPRVIVEVPESAEVAEASESALVWEAGGGAATVSLKGGGKDTLVTVMGARGGISGAADWNEVAVKRSRQVEGQATPLQYIILCDVEKILYEADERHNIPVYGEDFIFLHQAEAPILNELLKVSDVVGGAFSTNVSRFFGMIDLVKDRF
ncbi:MAG: polysaccharide biosynthesis/export family protein [Planctomycetes bacterium]|nr:polysaccharide biosynthesis/export family protein [Planctomycetota bacterium]